MLISHTKTLPLKVPIAVTDLVELQSSLQIKALVSLGVHFCIKNSIIWDHDSLKMMPL